MDLQLKGHRAVVTGSSGGIGEAIARRLSAEGAAVVAHGVEEFSTGSKHPAAAGATTGRR